MTPTQEFLRRVELKLQAIRVNLTDGRIDKAMDNTLRLERLVRDEREAADAH